MGRRPVLLLSRNSAYSVRSSVTVAPITRTVRHIRAEVPLSIKEGMPSDCVVNLDDILTIRKSKLTDRITMVSSAKMDAVTDAITFVLDLRPRET